MFLKDESQSNDENTDRQISNSNSHQDQSHLPPRNSSASPASQSLTYTGTPTNTSSPHPNNHHSGSLLNVKNPSPSDLVSEESQGFDISGSPTPPMSSGNSYAMQGSPSRHIQTHEVDSLGTDF